MGNVISPSAAREKLGVTSAKLTLLNRRGVIRKYNTHYWGGLLKEDVDKLAEAYKKHGEKTAQARRAEEDMARENMVEFLRTLDPDKTTKFYREAVRDPTLPISRVMEKKTEQNSDVGEDPLYEFLYMLDNETLDLFTALLLRAWVRRTSKSHVQFAVNRVSLPPINKWHDPRHKQVVDMLIEAASNMFDVQFDIMDVADYNTVALGKDSSQLMEFVNGLTVTDKPHLHALVNDARNTANHIPLRLRMDYWYRCYKNLLQTGVFAVNLTRYVQKVVGDMLPPHDKTNMAAFAEMHEKLQKAIGSYWSRLYDSKWLPTFIGELPYIEVTNHLSCFELDPADKELHPETEPSEIPSMLWQMNEQNYDASVEFGELHHWLSEFHRKVAMAMPSQSRVDQGFVSALLKALSNAGVNPSHLYLEPYLHGEQLMGKRQLLDAALDSALASLSLQAPSEEQAVAQGERAQKVSKDTEDLQRRLVQDAMDRAAEDGVTIDEEDRVTMLPEYYESHGLDPEGDRPADDLLDAFILKQWGYMG